MPCVRRMCCSKTIYFPWQRISSLHHRKEIMSTPATGNRTPAWPGSEHGKPTGIYHNAIRFVLENDLQLRGADEIAEAILEEFGEYRNGWIEIEIRSLARSFAANRWWKSWLS